LKIRKASTAYPENSEKKNKNFQTPFKKKNVQNIQENSKETLAQSTTSLHIIAKQKNKSFQTNPNHSICFFKQILPNKSKSIQKKIQIILEKKQTKSFQKTTHTTLISELI